MMMQVVTNALASSNLRELVIKVRNSSSSFCDFYWKRRGMVGILFRNYLTHGLSEQTINFSIILSRVSEERQIKKIERHGN